MARRGGVKRIQYGIYDSTRVILRNYLEDVSSYYPPPTEFSTPYGGIFSSQRFSPSLHFILGLAG